MKPEPTTDDPIELAAAEWLVRQDRGLTPAEQAEFEAWRRADARHAALYQALAGSWDVMSDARHAPSLLAGQAEREAARAADAAAPRRRRTWRVGIGLAAAAALVFSSVVGYREYRARPFAGTLATQVGGVERLTLPDGSTITLNTDSAVAVQVDRATRRVALQRGEAHFTVAKDRSRPFIVSANGVDVRAVGTAFSVRLRAEVVDVLVTEGKVSVAPPEAAGGAAGGGECAGDGGQGVGGAAGGGGRRGGGGGGDGRRGVGRVGGSEGGDAGGRRGAGRAGSVSGDGGASHVGADPGGGRAGAGD